MQVILGVIFHFIGGFASGSFYMPYKKVRGWSWESYWIVGGLFSWLVVPPLAAWLTIPNFSEIISNTGGSTLFYTFFFPASFMFLVMVYSHRFDLNKSKKKQKTETGFIIIIF